MRLASFLILVVPALCTSVCQVVTETVTVWVSASESTQQTELCSTTTLTSTMTETMKLITTQSHALSASPPPSAAGRGKSTSSTPWPPAVQPTPSPAPETPSTAYLPASSVPLRPPPQSASPSQSQSGGVPPQTSSYGAPPSATFNPKPLPAKLVFKSPSNFAALVAQPDSILIKNSCKYDVFFASEGCGTGTQNQTIHAGETFTEPVRACPPSYEGASDGKGTQLRITSANHPKVMLSEYAVDTKGLLYYNLSFLICMVPNSTDLSGCTGWEDGLQCTGGGKESPVWACQPGEYCDRVGYTVDEYGYQPSPPVGATQKDKGFVWEICAGNWKH